MKAEALAVALAAMLTVVGGAAAVTGTGATNAMTATNADAGAAGSADVAATYENGTVTVTVTRGGEAVENATVETADGEYTTDANGIVVAENVSVGDELEVEVDGEGFDGEVEYVVDDGGLTLVEEEYEYETADGNADDREENAEDGEENADDEAEDSDDEEDEEEDDDDEEEEDDEEEADDEDDDADDDEEDDE
ncbi:hypothetical protein [Halosegnis marinus]|uniref:Uncharacterized protein n=1 Tax=Halosegnis marinus TaxID=3034023 RepID=A0ABD5ZP99_9EURY|nr:hypothetical protein [Halosegnis sp. DT85]